MRIVDNTGRFSQAEQEELVYFVANHILSTEIDSDWLDVIRIRNDGRTDYLGYWTAQFHFDPQNIIDGIAAVIVLNYFYLKTVDALKETLAHEYGHHWTLLYCAVNQGIDIWNQRMPREYYQLRGLNDLDYAHDYSQGWEKCDKEIAAEDYRVLFAPHPYNREHRMVGVCAAQPNQAIANYIENLQYAEGQQ